jgi:hypothetical protein
VERITDLVSFYPETVTITIEGEELEPVPVRPSSPTAPTEPQRRRDRGIHLIEDAVPAQVWA